VCACFKYEFMYLAIKEVFFRLNVDILAEFVFRLFQPFKPSQFSIKF
jgi:hypothetical protein